MCAGNHAVLPAQDGDYSKAAQFAASSVPGVALDAAIHAHRLSGSRAAPASALSFASPSRSHGSTAHVPRGIGGAAVQFSSPMHVHVGPSLPTRLRTARARRAARDASRMPRTSRGGRGGEQWEGRDRGRARHGLAISMSFHGLVTSTATPRRQSRHGLHHSSRRRDQRGVRSLHVASPALGRPRAWSATRRGISER